MISSGPRRKRLLAGASTALLAVLGATACSAPATSPTEGYTSSVVGDIVALSGADAENLGGGLTIPVGLNVALSGSGAYYGDVMVKAAQLAAGQIEAAGGPTFRIEVKDHKSGDAQAGVQTTRELGEEDVHLALYSYIAVLGSALQGIEQYEILSLDGGGGTDLFAQSKPYFYGTRPVEIHEKVQGAAEYVAAAMPDVTQVAILISDDGAEITSDRIESITEAFDDVGITIAATEVTPFGGTDYSSAISKIIASGAQLIFTKQAGTDGGYFLKQLRAAGSDIPVIGSEFIPDIPDIAGSAADGYMFAMDYFDPENATNLWGQYMVDTAAEAYPDLVVDLYFANYYEDMFTLWQVVQRVLAEGGDVSDPATLLAAFESDPEFPSVYGGETADEFGVQEFDLATHTLSQRTMGVYRYDGEITQLATYGIRGQDFALVE